MQATRTISLFLLLGFTTSAHALTPTRQTPQALKKWPPAQSVESTIALPDEPPPVTSADFGIAAPKPAPKPAQRPIPKSQVTQVKKAPAKRTLPPDADPKKREPTPIESKEVDSNVTPDAQKLASALEIVGYKCHLADPTSLVGYNCIGKVTDYPGNVNIYFPRYLSAAKVSLAYHFHGLWYGSRDDGMSPVSNYNGNFGAFILESRKNVIVIVPESPKKSPVFSSELKSPDQLNTFFKRIDQTLEGGGIAIKSDTPIVLSGHSNAYSFLGQLGSWADEGKLPRLKALHGFALLDAAYGYREGLVKIANVMKKNGHMLYFAAYNTNDGQADKTKNYRRIHAELGQDPGPAGRPQIVFVADPSTQHMQMMKKYLANFWKLSLP